MDKKQPNRYNNLELENVPDHFKGHGWIKAGLSWSVFMYVCMTAIFPLIGDESLTLSKALIGIPIWTIGGLGFGYAMNLINGKSKVKIKIN